MDAIIQNTQQHIIKFAPNSCDPIPLRWKVVLDYHLAGLSNEEIAEKTGYTVNSIYRILNHENTQYVRQQLLDNTQQEFQALFSKVVGGIRKDLDSGDGTVRVATRNQWLKAHGKISESKGNSAMVTAENVVFNMLNGDGVNAIKQGS